MGSMVFITAGIALFSDAVPTSATRVKDVTHLLEHNANSIPNCYTVCHSYRGNYTYNTGHCLSLKHGFDFVY